MRKIAAYLKRLRGETNIAFEEMVDAERQSRGVEVLRVAGTNNTDAVLVQRAGNNFALYLTRKRKAVGTWRSRELAHLTHCGDNAPIELVWRSVREIEIVSDCRLITAAGEVTVKEVGLNLASLTW